MHHHALHGDTSLDRQDQGTGLADHTVRPVGTAATARLDEPQIRADHMLSMTEIIWRIQVVDSSELVATAVTISK